MQESAPATPILDTQLFRDAFNTSPIGIAVENLDGQPLFVNPAFCRFLGFTEEELRTKHCVDFSPKEDGEKDWTLFQQLRAGSIDHYQLEKQYLRRDRSLVWGRLSISLMKSRPSPLVIAMVEDITAEKRAEEAMRENEERLRLAQRAAGTPSALRPRASMLLPSRMHQLELLPAHRITIPREYQNREVVQVAD